MSEKDPNLIYPGDPRHPCPICSGRPTKFLARHIVPCRPAPLSRAYVPPDKDQDTGQ